MFISVFFEMVGLSLIYPLLSFILGNFDNQYLSIIANFLSYLLNTSVDFEKYDIRQLIILIIFILIIYSAKLILGLILVYLNSNLTYKIQADISKNLFKKYLYQENLKHIAQNTSSKIRNIITETQVFSIEFITPLLILITDILTIIGLALVLFLYFPHLTLITLLIIFLICLIFLFFTRKKMKSLGYQRQDYEHRRIKFFNEGINSLKELRISKKEKIFFDNFTNFNTKLSKVSAKQGFLTGAPQIMLEFFAISFLVLIIYYLSINSSENINVISSLGLFSAAFFKIIPSLYRSVSCFNRLRFSLPVVDLLYSELINFSYPKIYKKSIKNFGNNKDKITFQNVSFKYPHDDKDIFKNVNFDIKLGRIICIKGNSGAGKSTLIDLILGLNKPQSGKILFNNKLTEKNISTYYQSFYYLPQSIYLLDDTILKNIIFDDENIYNKELLKMALQVSELENFVDSLDMGIMTYIGENGSKISGGQRQRIGIARAIYNKRAILIMDESTNALDFDTEKKIISNLKKVKAIKTIFLITHREKMLVNANTILEIKNHSINKKKNN